MYADIVKKNPHLKIYRTSDPEFIPFGYRITDIDAAAFIEASKKADEVKEGSLYVAEADYFKDLDVAKDVEIKYYGELPAQAGYCYGYSNKLNAVEWHKSSEINVATTDLILFLGSVQDIVDRKIDSSKIKAFYVEKGEVLEVYATTLHFCPCQVSEAGFGCVVVLPKGTNVPLEGEYEDKLMFRKNKWILAHVDNKGLIDRGVIAGVTGENYEVKY
ncbi:MAG: DUF4867 family protein [Clostridia bacterium]|nr:DUF4867 family protein [Clostridia bacterium]